jgi:hypothetical protein
LKPQISFIFPVVFNTKDYDYALKIVRKLSCNALKFGAKIKLMSANFNFCSNNFFKLFFVFTSDKLFLAQDQNSRDGLIRNNDSRRTNEKFCK